MRIDGDFKLFFFHATKVWHVGRYFSNYMGAFFEKILKNFLVKLADRVYYPCPSGKFRLDGELAVILEVF